jgi:hypothetical protein
MIAPRFIGNVLDRCITDAGYRGHNASPDHKFKVYTAGQKRHVTATHQRHRQTNPRRRSSASSNDGPPSSPSSVTSSKSTAWAAIISPIQPVMPSMPCSPPPDTTSAASSGG